MEITLFFSVFVGILFVVLKKHHLPRFINNSWYRIAIVLLCATTLFYRFEIGFLLSLILFFTIVLQEIPDVSEFFREEEEEEEESPKCSNSQYYDMTEEVCKDIQLPSDCNDNEEYNGYICQPIDFSKMPQNQIDEEMMIGPMTDTTPTPSQTLNMDGNSNMYECASDEYFDSNQMKCVKRVL
jgi:hypothetical protein